MSDGKHTAGNLTALRSEMMQRVSAINRAIEASTTLDWLEKYGPNLIGPDAASITINFHYAGSCEGSAEAKVALTAALQGLLQQAVSIASDEVRSAILRATGGGA